MQTGRDDALPLCCGQMLAVLAAGLALVFWPWPELDLLTSGLFDGPAAGLLLADHIAGDGVFIASKATSFACTRAALVLLPASLTQHRAEAQVAGLYRGLGW